MLVNCRGGRSRSVALVGFLHVEMPERYPTLESALAHVRTQRDLQPDEWFETPKPTSSGGASSRSLDRTGRADTRATA